MEEFLIDSVPKISPYKELLSSSTHDFIHRRFGELIPDDMISIVFNISTASSPGHY